MEKSLSSSESLAIITEMIAKAKKETSGDGSYQLLLWGWAVSLCNLGQYVLQKQGFQKPYMVWLLIIPAVLLSVRWGYLKAKNSPVKSHLGMMVNQIWIAVFVAIVVVLGAMPILGYNHNPVILLLVAVGMFATGSIIRVNVFKYGAGILAIGAIIAFRLPVVDQNLAAAVAIILGYLIPGYYLKNKYRARV
ncbi:hypothetical protein LZF95_10190 [Algoriphagus sp. AGSA1]|uniref:hypothetical protein n=1 Tax=Algoriphagus sp. AGSA1 TaxID=2907213 RepID=UPI001F3CE367|nr:hypothetical protein [Algoriphagus sp. AGSA1]MCE7055043.1 hypothetical protein [Algoriphagus sp. AGSA1]